MKTYTCAICGVQFGRYGSTPYKFCSLACMGKGRDLSLRDGIARRFWAKVQKGDGCWEWQGYRGHWGYGRAKIQNVHDSAHRHVWRLTYGPIPDGLWVLHKCDNPPCVRPDHLFLGTPADNSADMARKGRAHGPGKSHVTKRMEEVAVEKIEALA